MNVLSAYFPDERRKEKGMRIYIHINQKSNKTSVILQDGVIFKSLLEKKGCRSEGRIESFLVIYSINGKGKIEN